MSKQRGSLTAMDRHAPPPKALTTPVLTHASKESGATSARPTLAPSRSQSDAKLLEGQPTPSPVTRWRTPSRGPSPLVAPRSLSPSVGAVVISPPGTQSVGKAAAGCIAAMDARPGRKVPSRQTWGASVATIVTAASASQPPPKAAVREVSAKLEVSGLIQEETEDLRTKMRQLNGFRPQEDAKPEVIRSTTPQVAFTRPQDPHPLSRTMTHMPASDPSDPRMFAARLDAMEARTAAVEAECRSLKQKTEEGLREGLVAVTAQLRRDLTDVQNRLTAEMNSLQRLIEAQGHTTREGLDRAISQERKQRANELDALRTVLGAEARLAGEMPGAVAALRKSQDELMASVRQAGAAEGRNARGADGASTSRSLGSGAASGPASARCEVETVVARELLIGSASTAPAPATPTASSVAPSELSNGASHAQLRHLYVTVPAGAKPMESRIKVDVGEYFVTMLVPEWAGPGDRVDLVEGTGECWECQRPAEGPEMATLAAAELVMPSHSVTIPDDATPGVTELSLDMDGKALAVTVPEQAKGGDRLAVSFNQATGEWRMTIVRSVP